MSFDPFTAGFDLSKTILDKFFPDANKELEAKINAAAQEIQNEYSIVLAQLAINKSEAENSSVFVSGWRPFVGWTCAVSLAYVGLFEPLARFVSVVVFAYTGVFPVIDTTITMQILTAILGIGGFRTFERLNGVERKK